VDHESGRRAKGYLVVYRLAAPLGRRLDSAVFNLAPSTLGSRRYAVAVWIGRFSSRARALQQRGIRATGVVLEVFKPWMNVVINNVYIRRRLRLRIQRQDGTPAYEGILKGLFMLGEIPSVGDRLSLRVDPANPQHFDYDEASTATATAQAASAAASDSGDSRLSDSRLSDELARLADLHKRGALTDSEFAAAKKKLLR
jgi:hypothetical protein